MKEKMQSIKDKIIKTEKVEWKKLKPLQGDNLKEFSQENYEKLKNSLLNNSFIDPLNVWESKGEIYILDGHHRVKMFFNLEKEGVSVPEKLTANFIDCKNKKEAAKVLLLACADYAKVKDKGLYDFLSVNELNFEDIKFEMDIPTISFSKFEDSFYKDEKTQKEEKLNEVPEVEKEVISQLGDLFLIDGRHRILCGDSTKEEDVKLLLQDKEIDLCFTDPPYEFDKEKLLNIFSNFNTNNHLLMLTFKQAAYLSLSELFEFHFDLILYFKTPNSSMNKKVPYYLHKNLIYLTKIKDTIFNCDNAKGIFSDAGYYPSVIEGKKETAVGHGLSKPPTSLIKILSGFKCNSIIDCFLGSGSTLIACEETKRICYGIEFEPKYVDLILRRYHKLYSEQKIECLNNHKFNFNKLFNG